MAAKTLSVRFTTEGLSQTTQALASVGNAFDATLRRAQEAVEKAKANVKAAQGDMSRNIPVFPGALEQAKASLAQSQRQLDLATNSAFRQLGLRSQLSIEKQKAALIDAFNAIKASGVATAQDIANAQAVLKRKLAELDGQLDKTSDKTRELANETDRLAAITKKASDGYSVFKNILANIGTEIINRATSALLNMGTQVLQVGAQAEKTAVAFETFLGSAEQAKTVMAQVRDFAATTPFELPEVTEAAKQLLATKTPVEELIPTIKMLGEIAAGADKPLSQLLFIYTQVKNQGRATGEDINQLLNAGLSMEDIAQALGKTAQELGRMKGSSQGLQLSFEEVQKVLQGVTSEGGRFNGLMDKLGSTTAVKLSNLNDAFTKIYQSVYDGLSPAISAVLDTIVKTLDPLGNNQEIWKGINKEAQNFRDYIAQNPGIAQALNQALTEGVNVALSGAASTARKLLEYLQKNPSAIADAVKVLQTLVGVMEGFVKLVFTAVQGWEKIAALAQQTGSFLTGKGGTVEQASREQIRNAFGEQGVAEFDRQVAELDKPKLGGNFINLIPGAKDKAIGEIAVELLANYKKYGLSQVTPGQPAPGSGVTAPTAQKFFPVAKGNIGTSPGQKFDAPRMRNGRPGKHNGIDITATQGEPVHAVVGGRITEIRVLDPAVGSHGIFIQGADGNTWTYNHVVPAPGLKVGATVGNGQQIAQVSADDKLSQGAHLDIKVKNSGGAYFDPTSLLSQLPRPTQGNLQRAQSSAPTQTAQTARVASSAMSGAGGGMAMAPQGTPQTVRGGAPQLSATERKELLQMMMAEAEGEGVKGMAAVGRSILNRYALILSGTAPLGSGGYGVKDKSLGSVLRAKTPEGKYSYSPMADGRFTKQFSQTVQQQAEQAFSMLLNDSALSSMGLSQSVINSPNFQSTSLGVPSWWQGGASKVERHNFGRDKFSVSRNVSDLVSRFIPAAPSSQTTTSTTAISQEESRAEKLRESARSRADREALAQLKESHEKRLHELRLQSAAENQIAITRIQQSQEVSELESRQAIDNLRRLQSEKIKAIQEGKTGEAVPSSDRDLAAEIQVLVNDLGRSRAKTKRELELATRERDKTEAERRISEEAEIRSYDTAQAERALRIARERNDVAERYLVLLEAQLDVSKLQSQIDELNAKIKSEVIPPDQVESTRRRIADLESQKQSVIQSADIKVSQIDEEERLRTEERSLQLAQERNQLDERAVFLRQSQIALAKIQTDIDQLNARIQSGAIPEEQLEGAQQRLKDLQTEKQTLTEITEARLAEIDRQRDLAARERNLSRLSRERVIAEQDHNLERVRALEIVAAEESYELERARIQREITDEAERQLELAILEAELSQNLRQAELSYIQSRQSDRRETRETESRNAQLRAGLETNSFEANRIREEDARRNAQFDYEERVESIRQKYGDDTEETNRRIQQEEENLALTLQQIDREFLDVSETVGMGLSGAFDSFFQALLNGENALDAFAQSLLKVFADLGQQLLQSSVQGALGGIFGFSSGGYTGAGGKYQPAGIVHAGEFVVTKEATEKIGLPFLNALNQLPGYAVGGLVERLKEVREMRQSLPGYYQGGSVVNALRQSEDSQCGVTSGAVSAVSVLNALRQSEESQQINEGANDSVVVLNALRQSETSSLTLPGYSSGGLVERLKDVFQSRSSRESNVQRIAHFNPDSPQPPRLPGYSSGGLVSSLREVFQSKERQSNSADKSVKFTNLGQSPAPTLSIPGYSRGGFVSQLKDVFQSRSKDKESQTLKTWGTMPGYSSAGFVSSLKDVFQSRSKDSKVMGYAQGGLVKSDKLSLFQGLKEVLAPAPTLALPGYFSGGLVASFSGMPGAPQISDTLLQNFVSVRPQIATPTPSSSMTSNTTSAVSNTLTVNINDKNSRFYTQSRTLARDLADKLRG